MQKCTVFYTVYATALCKCISMASIQACQPNYSVHSILNNGPQPLNFSRANSKEAARLSVYIWLNIIN